MASTAFGVSKSSASAFRTLDCVADNLDQIKTVETKRNWKPRHFHHQLFQAMFTQVKGLGIIHVFSMRQDFISVLFINSRPFSIHIIAVNNTSDSTVYKITVKDGNVHNTEKCYPADTRLQVKLRDVFICKTSDLFFYFSMSVRHIQTTKLDINPLT